MSEFNVFLAATRWVDADKSREQLLDEVLGLIRFPTMDYEELGLVGKHPTAAGAPILKVGSFHQPSHPFVPVAQLLPLLPKSPPTLKMSWGTANPCAFTIVRSNRRLRAPRHANHAQWLDGVLL